MNYEQNFNDKALEFYAKHSSHKIPENSFNRNCSPTHINPVSAKQMQFNTYTNHISDNNEGHLIFSNNVCGNKTPSRSKIESRKRLGFSVVMDD